MGVGDCYEGGGGEGCIREMQLFLWKGYAEGICKITKRHERGEGADCVLADYKQHYDYLRHLVPKKNCRDHTGSASKRTIRAVRSCVLMWRIMVSCPHMCTFAHRYILFFVQNEGSNRAEFRMRNPALFFYGTERKCWGMARINRPTFLNVVNNLT